MRRRIFIIVGSILLGGLIYLTYRIDSLKMFKWFDHLGATDLILFLRNNSLIQGLQLPDWVKFSLPDALWVLSFTYAMLFLWQFKVTKQNILWILMAPIIGVFSEIGQFFGIVPGTFDIIDLLLLIIAVAIPLSEILFIHLKSINNDEIKKHV